MNLLYLYIARKFRNHIFEYGCKDKCYTEIYKENCITINKIYA